MCKPDERAPSFIFKQLKIGCVLDPRIACNDSGWFSTLKFLLLAPELLAKIKTTIFFSAFCPLILRLELSHNAF